MNTPSRFLDDIPEELILPVFSKKKGSNFEEVENFLDDDEDGDVDFKVGDKVRHNQFGEGRIVEAREGRIAVAFAGKGIKRLVPGLAKIKKI